MGFDTKYRPRNYDDVIGQDASVEVLRQIVKEGRGFRQSYVFCGQHGSGKTTMGRILARALLCLNPQDGNPCDECHSCKVLLSGGTHEGFEELDAASKSKVSDLEKIIEDINYHTFSNTRRIYLFDESHRLSKQALDKLLKPMEDNVEGTEDKQLICIFCTTDPGKMASTIFSRCAPAFVIRACTAEQIAGRLAWVCDQEGVQYDLDALATIAEVSEFHIRDSLMKVDSISLLGPITEENVSKFLHLGTNVLAIELLEALGSDLARAVELAGEISHDVSPAIAYERLSEGAMCAYRSFLGVGKIPAHWRADRIQQLGSRGQALLSIASRFAAPPHRPTRDTLVLDVGTLHFALTGGVSPTKTATLVLEVQSTSLPSGVPEAPSSNSKEPEVSSDGKDSSSTAQKTPQAAGKVPPDEVQAKTTDGVWIDPKGIGHGAGVAQERPAESSSPKPKKPLPELEVSSGNSGALPPHVFRELFAHYLRGMRDGVSTNE